MRDPFDIFIDILLIIVLIMVLCQIYAYSQAPFYYSPILFYR